MVKLITRKKVSSSNTAPKVEQKTTTISTTSTPKASETKDMSSYTSNSTSTTTSTVKPVVLGTDSMTEKTKVQTTTSTTTVKEDQNVVLKVIGLAIIIFGLLALLILGVIAIVTRISPRVDTSMEVPVVSSLAEYTNQDSVRVEGTVSGVSQVIIYADGVVDSVVDVKNGRFDKTFKLTTEKKYTYEAAGVQGVILRSRSEKSDPVSTIYDKTGPSSKVEIFELPEEVTTSKLDIKGQAEPNTTITFKSDNKNYPGKVDSSGNYKVTIPDLKPGENIFSIEIKDAAGNITQVKKTFKVVYNVRANINTTGASTNAAAATTTSTNNALPNSAGPLDDAMAAVMQNKFIFGFGVFALFLLLANSSIVGVKLFFENKKR
jgi:hypothetical protein